MRDYNVSGYKSSNTRGVLVRTDVSNYDEATKVHEKDNDEDYSYSRLKNMWAEKSTKCKLQLLLPTPTSRLQFKPAVQESRLSKYDEQQQEEKGVLKTQTNNSRIDRNTLSTEKIRQYTDLNRRMQLQLSETNEPMRHTPELMYSSSKNHEPCKKNEFNVSYDVNSMKETAPIATTQEINDNQNKSLQDDEYVIYYSNLKNHLFSSDRIKGTSYDSEINTILPMTNANNTSADVSTTSAFQSAIKPLSAYKIEDPYANLDTMSTVNSEVTVKIKNTAALLNRFQKPVKSPYLSNLIDDDGGDFDVETSKSMGSPLTHTSLQALEQENHYKSSYVEDDELSLNAMNLSRLNGSKAPSVVESDVFDGLSSIVSSAYHHVDFTAASVSRLKSFQKLEEYSKMNQLQRFNTDILSLSNGGKEENSLRLKKEHIPVMTKTRGEEQNYLVPVSNHTQKVSDKQITLNSSVESTPSIIPAENTVTLKDTYKEESKPLSTKDSSSYSTITTGNTAMALVNDDKEAENLTKRDPLPSPNESSGNTITRSIEGDKNNHVSSSASFSASSDDVAGNAATLDIIYKEKSDMPSDGEMISFSNEEARDNITIGSQHKKEEYTSSVKSFSTFSKEITTKAAEEICADETDKSSNEKFVEVANNSIMSTDLTWLEESSDWVSFDNNSFDKSISIDQENSSNVIPYGIMKEVVDMDSSMTQHLQLLRNTIMTPMPISEAVKTATQNVNDDINGELLGISCDVNDSYLSVDQISTKKVHKNNSNEIYFDSIIDSIKWLPSMIRLYHQKRSIKKDSDQRSLNETNLSVGESIKAAPVSLLHYEHENDVEKHIISECNLKGIQLIQFDVSENFGEPLYDTEKLISNIAKRVTFEPDVKEPICQYLDKLPVSPKSTMNNLLLPNIFEKAIEAHMDSMKCLQTKQFDAAMEFYEEFLEKVKEYECDSESSKQSLSSTFLSNIGILHLLVGEHDLCVDFLQASIETKRASVDLQIGSKEVALCLNEMGIAYFASQMFDDALTAFVDALGIWKKLGIEDDVNVSIVLNNIGATFSLMEEFDNALESYNEALQIHRSILLKNLNRDVNVWSIEEEEKSIKRDLLHTSHTLCNTAHVYGLIGSKNEAKFLLEAALPLLKIVEDNVKQIIRVKNLVSEFTPRTYTELNERLVEV